MSDKSVLDFATQQLINELKLEINHWQSETYKAKIETLKANRTILEIKKAHYTKNDNDADRISESAGIGP